jgi:hypothetical protein
MLSRKSGLQVLAQHGRLFVAQAETAENQAYWRSSSANRPVESAVSRVTGSVCPACGSGVAAGSGQDTGQVLLQLQPAGRKPQLDRPGLELPLPPGGLQVPRRCERGLDRFLAGSLVHGNA